MPVVAFLIPHHQSQSLFMSCALQSQGISKHTPFFNLGVDPCLVCCAVVVLLRSIWTFAQKCRWIVLKSHLNLVSGAENGGDRLRMKMQVAPWQINTQFEHQPQARPSTTAEIQFDNSLEFNLFFGIKSSAIIFVFFSHPPLLLLQWIMKETCNDTRLQFAEPIPVSVSQGPTHLLLEASEASN